MQTKDTEISDLKAKNIVRPVLERKAPIGSSLLPLVDDDAGLEAYDAIDNSRKRTESKN